MKKLLFTVLSISFLVFPFSAFAYVSALAPEINQASKMTRVYVEGNKVTYFWLTSQPMRGELWVGKNSVEMTLNGKQQPYTAVNNGTKYDMIIKSDYGDMEVTYNKVTTTLQPGVYYIRPVSYSDSGPIYGEEIRINIK